MITLIASSSKSDLALCTLLSQLKKTLLGSPLSICLITQKKSFDKDVAVEANLFLP